MELLRNNRERGKYLINNYVRIIAMTSTYAILKNKSLITSNFNINTVIFEESGQLLDFETFAPLTLSRQIKRIVMIGDDNQLPPLVKNQVIKNVANLKQSLFVRLIRLGYPVSTLKQQGRAREEILELYRWKYDNLVSMKHVFEQDIFQGVNKGFQHNVQFISVPGSEVRTKRLKKSKNQIFSKFFFFNIF